MIPRIDQNQILVTTISGYDGNVPTVALSADSYRLGEPVPLSRQWFPFPPLSSGNIIGY